MGSNYSDNGAEVKSIARRGSGRAQRSHLAPMQYQPITLDPEASLMFRFEVDVARHSVIAVVLWSWQKQIGADVHVGENVTETDRSLIPAVNHHSR